MKKLIALLIIFLFPLFIYGTDYYNVGTQINMVQDADGVGDATNATGYYETSTSIIYTFKATWVDSTDDLHSKPMFIADCNDVDAYCSAYVSAASNVNIIYHFSYDNRNTWTTTTPLDLDALSSSVVGDTLGVEETIDDADGFHTGVWLVVEFTDGGTTLNDGEVCIWQASFQKDDEFTKSSGDYKRIDRNQTCAGDRKNVIRLRPDGMHSMLYPMSIKCQRNQSQKAGMARPTKLLSSCLSG